MNKTIAFIYNKLFKKGDITEDQIPQEAKDIYNEAIQEIVYTDIEKFGAFTIPHMNISMDDSYEATIKTNDIFTDELIGTNHRPEDIIYSLFRVEKNPLEFSGNVSVEIVDQSQDGFGIKAAGERNGIVDLLFRIDVLIESSNYEDMIVSIYCNRK